MNTIKIALILASCATTFIVGSGDLYAIGRDSAQTPQELSGEPTLTCEQKAQACLAQNDEQKQQCLYHFVNSPTCGDEPISKLLRLRWIAGNKNLEVSDVNFERCLKNFDNSLYSTLLTDKLTADQISSLSQGLNACHPVPTEDMLRP